jgi:hypothetical protein
MSKFQELMVGLLALRHPEMFSLRFRPNSKRPGRSISLAIAVHSLRDSGAALGTRAAPPRKAPGLPLEENVRSPWLAPRPG